MRNPIQTVSERAPQSSLRRVTADDRQTVIALIDTVYREFGDSVFLSGYDADLTRLPQAYTEAGGDFVVLTNDAGDLLATHAVLPLAVTENAVQLKRFYVRADHRGTGLGRCLMDWALDWSRERGQRRIELWTDVRFRQAHAIYERWGFVRQAIRSGEDGNMPYQEYQYTRDIDHA
ncbi:MAG: GNAT family N-acetyltransferase [Opitutales bacterium]